MNRRGAAMGAALASTCLVAVSLAPVQAADEPRRYLSGWLPYWSTQTSTASFATNSELFSDISPFWHNAAWNGSRVFIEDHLNDSARAKALAQLQGKGVKILPSITDGTGKGRMAATLADPQKRASHIEEIVALVMDNGYDGIDLDYEVFAFTDGSSSWAATRPNWVKFVNQLADALHAQGKLLAITIPPMYDDDYDSSSGYWVYDYAAMGKAADIVRIMAYDYSVSSPGPIAPLDWVRKVAAFAASEMPPEKVQLGVPVYGRSWYVSKTGKCPVDQDISDSNRAITAGSALSSLAEEGVSPSQIQRDPASGELNVSYSITYRGLNAKGEKTQCTVSRKAFFADAKSVADRVTMARKAGLGGAALWTIGGEAADQWPALRKAVGTAKDTPGSQKVANVKMGAPKFVTHGQEASFTAKVTVDGKSSKGGTAVLQVKRPGSKAWRNLATLKVPKSGLVVFKYAPKSTARYRVNVSETGERKAARSSALTTKVRASVSVSSAVVALTGQKVRLKGSITPGKPSVTVVRQRLVDGAWESFGRTKTNAKGKYSFSVIPTVRNTTYTYRVVSAPYDGLARGYSSTVSFRSR